jgi:hypothetical protein
MVKRKRRKFLAIDYLPGISGGELIWLSGGYSAREAALSRFTFFV